MTIRLLNTGTFFADGGAMFGAVPRSAWGRRYPFNYRNDCKLAMLAGLITTDDGRVILIDNGYGTKRPEPFTRTALAFHHIQDPAQTLARLGIPPESVTDIILTHLHFDHCGGTTRLGDRGRIIPTYPNAQVHVSLAQLRECAAPNPLEVDSFSTDHIDAIRQAGLLHPITEPQTYIHPHIRLTLHDGHTAGQIAVRISPTDGRTGGILFPGDIVPTAAHLSPTWLSAYDISPLDSLRAKCQLLDEAARDHLTIVFYHDAFHPYATIRKTRNFYTIAQPEPGAEATPITIIN